MTTQPTAAPHPEATAPDEDVLHAAIASGDADACRAWVGSASGQDTRHAIGALDDEERAELLRLLGPDLAAELIEQMPEAVAVEALEDLDAAVAAEIIEELPSDEQADLIRALDDRDAEAILGQLDRPVAAGIRRLAEYDDESAGGLMLTEFFAYNHGLRVADVLDDLVRHADRYREFNIQYTYITDDTGGLVGVVPVRRMLLAGREATLADIMIADPVRVTDTDDLERLASVFREHPFIGLPVTDENGTLLGVVEARAVESAASEETEDLYRQSQGIVGGEELRSMPLLVRSGRRLAWLSANIVLNVIAASIIALHEETLEAVIALAVFLPIISDMSGCSGSQAVAVSMRELTLGVTRPTDLLRVLRKEISLGLLNGAALGLLIALVAFLWKGNAALGAVVGGALMANTMVAVCIGGAIPLVLKRLRLDPALASGPILTTITDMCGFMLVLSLAAASMSYLTV